MGGSVAASIIVNEAKRLAISLICSFEMMLLPGMLGEPSESYHINQNVRPISCLSQTCSSQRLASAVRGAMPALKLCASIACVIRWVRASSQPSRATIARIRAAASREARGRSWVFFSTATQSCKMTAAANTSRSHPGSTSAIALAFRQTRSRCDASCDPSLPVGPSSAHRQSASAAWSPNSACCAVINPHIDLQPAVCPAAASSFRRCAVYPAGSVFCADCHPERQSGVLDPAADMNRVGRQ